MAHDTNRDKAMDMCSNESPSASAKVPHSSMLVLLTAKKMAIRQPKLRTGFGRVLRLKRNCSQALAMRKGNSSQQTKAQIVCCDLAAADVVGKKLKAWQDV